MRPLLFDGFRAYTAFIAMGIAVGIGIAVIAFRQNRLPVGRFLVLETLVSASGLLGAKLYSLLARGIIAVPWTAAEATTFRYPGGLLASAIAVFALRPLLLPEVSLRALADLLAPSVAIAMAVVRVGCLCAGCCFGVPSSMPWAISFPESSPAWNLHVSQQLLSPSATASLPVEPLQLYFGVWSLAVGLGLLWLLPRRRYEGQVALWFLATHELGKFALEFLRHDDPSHSVWHLKAVSLAVGAAAAICVFARRRALAPERLSLGLGPGAGPASTR